ncbi:hypothetical protein [Microbulbifer discodermiae]|uniref:hypothetical protein n=1 Tax=Microbulbifer sp. 2201CG32-9 TaxID=3232309 RepID=UPI00345BEAFB
MKANYTAWTITSLLFTIGLLNLVHATEINSNDATFQLKTNKNNSPIVKPAARCAIDQAVKKTMQDHGIPGMAIAIVTKPEKPNIWSKGYGIKNLQDGGEVTQDTVFWLGNL